MKNLPYLFTFVLLCGCAINADTLNYRKEVGYGFVLGQSNKHTKDFGLWYIKKYVDPKVLNKEGETFDYLMVFRNPTEIATNEKFILLKRETEKNNCYKIIHIKNDSCFKFYRTHKFNKFLELRKKLKITDSLEFINVRPVPQ